MLLQARDITVLYKQAAGQTFWQYLKGFGRLVQAHTVALQAVTCEFTGGVNLIIGPNGSGKTTLLQVLAGLIAPQSGSIILNGQRISQPGLRSAAGYLPQVFGWYPDLTAREMLQYIALLKGMSDRSARVRSVETVLQQAGLGAVAEQKLATYSRGMRQKVGLAQALLGNPAVLLLDEPTAGLDPEERNKLRGLLAGIGQERTVILASSVLTDANCADRILILSQGQRCFWGTIPELAALGCMSEERPARKAGQQAGAGDGEIEKGYKAVLRDRVRL